MVRSDEYADAAGSKQPNRRDGGAAKQSSRPWQQRRRAWSRGAFRLLALAIWSDLMNTQTQLVRSSQIAATEARPNNPRGRGNNGGAPGPAARFDFLPWPYGPI